ncbi:MAG: hypothetical protein M1546_27565 [Chloroflexi bacterium]|nr:hypothetical protein [Chloroflexota bacterium]
MPWADDINMDASHKHAMTHELRPPRLLILTLLLLCLENAARAGLSILQAIQLSDLPTSLSPIYVATMSAVWAVGFAACAYGVARLNSWAPGAVVVTLLLYQANLWINRLAFSRSSEAFETTGFRALLSIALVGGVVGLLMWPTTRRAFAGRRRAQTQHLTDSDSATHLQ